MITLTIFKFKGKFNTPRTLLQANTHLKLESPDSRQVHVVLGFIGPKKQTLLRCKLDSNKNLIQRRVAL